MYRLRYKLFKLLAQNVLCDGLYDGELDAYNRPHGFGRFYTYSGVIMSYAGFWKDGFYHGPGTRFADGHGWFAGDYENGKMTGAGMLLTVSFQADQTVIVLTRGSFMNGVIVGNATRIMVGLSKDGRAVYSEWYFGTVCPHATTKHGAGTAVFQVCLWAIC